MQFRVRLFVFLLTVKFFPHQVNAVEQESTRVEDWFQDFDNLRCNIVITCDHCYNDIYWNNYPGHAVTLWNNRILRFPSTYYVPLKFKRIITRSGHIETFRYMAHCYANFILIEPLYTRAEILDDANMVFRLTEQHEYRTVTTSIFYHFFALKKDDELKRVISRVFIRRVSTSESPAYRNDYTRLAILKLDSEKSKVSSSSQCDLDQVYLPGLLRHNVPFCGLRSYRILRAYIPYIDGTVYRSHIWTSTGEKADSFVKVLEDIRHSLVIRSSAALTSSRGDAALVNDVSFPSHLVPPSILEIIRSINRAFTNKTITLNVPLEQIVDLTREPQPMYRRSIWYQLFYQAVPVIGGHMPTGDQYFDFITCYDPPEIRDPGYLIRPFGLSVWIACAASFAALCIFLKIFSIKIPNGDIVLYYFSALTENCQQEPRSSDVRARITLGIALIAGLLLSNAYRGCVTSKITAPQLKDRPHSFYDLSESNFTLFASATDKYRDLVLRWKSVDDVQKTSDWLTSQLDAETLSVFGNYSLARLTYIGITSLRQLQKKHKKWSTGSKYSYQYFPADHSSLASITQRIRFPQNFPLVTIEDELSKCGKTAYVDYSENLDSLKPNLTIWSPTSVNSFYQGKTELMKTPVGFGFSNIRTSGTRLKDGIQRVAVESGIFHWLHNRFEHKSRATLGMIWISQSRKTEIKKRSKGLSANSKEIRSSLELFSLLGILNTVVFLVEIIKVRFNRLQTDRDLSIIASTVVNLPLILVQPAENAT